MLINEETHQNTTKFGFIKSALGVADYQRSSIIRSSSTTKNRLLFEPIWYYVLNHAE